jgi:hypothetical protein
MNVNYPKVLSYAIMGTMPAIRIFDLKRPKFLQFILDLPEKFRKYKVQFLAAFIVDDGSIFGDISFCQKDPVMLTHIIQLCDHLGYDHSPLYRQERDGVHSFQLNQNGIQKFYNELQQLSSYDSCLNLWHKQEKLITLASSFSGERKDEQNHALALCIRILEILEDKKKYTTKDLWNHPELKLFTHEYPYYLFRRKIRLLRSRGAIKEIKKINKTSYRPKKWQINQNETSAKIVEEFKENYNKRTHKQKYKRRRITVEMVEEAIAKLQKQGIQRPGALAVSQEIGCSKKQLYTRKDLRKFIVDD